MKRHSLLALGLLGVTACFNLAACEHPEGMGTPEPFVTPATTRDALRDDMRKLWTEHVTWTRVFLISTIAGLPDAPQATERLLQNQVDIGNAIKPFYGESAGDRLTKLLKEHILGAAAVLGAAMAGDAEELAATTKAWFANADEIAQFLADANPKWRFSDLQMMMHDHLNGTLAEATARLNGDWDADVKAYDAVQKQILTMADELTDGIAAQLPSEVVTEGGRTQDAEALHVSMRALWQDHVIWTRVFLIDQIAGLPDTPQATERLLQNQVDLGDAIKPFYGGEAGDQLTVLLKEHITGAVEVLEAAEAGDQESFDHANASWYQNGYEIAEFLSEANSNLDEDELEEMMTEHLDQTLAEATFRLQNDWAKDVAEYDMIEDHILHMSDVLSEAISADFHGQPSSH